MTQSSVGFFVSSPNPEWQPLASRRCPRVAQLVALPPAAPADLTSQSTTLEESVEWDHLAAIPAPLHELSKPRGATAGAQTMPKCCATPLQPLLTSRRKAQLLRKVSNGATWRRFLLPFMSSPSPEGQLSAPRRCPRVAQLVALPPAAPRRQAQLLRNVSSAAEQPRFLLPRVSSPSPEGQQRAPRRC